MLVQEPDRSAGLVSVVIILLFFSVVAVVLRLWSRFLTTAPRYWWDDWLIIVNLPVFAAQVALVLQLVSIGYGKHQSAVNPANVALVYKYSFANNYLYATCITLPRLSAVMFYARIFHHHRSKVWYVAQWTTGTLIVVWYLFSQFFDTFQCYPVQKAWDLLLPGSCLSSDQWYIGIAISSMIIDFIVLILPMPLLWDMNVTARRKLFIAGVFICGYMALAASIARVIVLSIYKDTLYADITWNTIPLVSVIYLEEGISMVSVCLPSIFVLLKRAKRYGVSSLFSTRGRTRDPLMTEPDPEAQPSKKRSRQRNVLSGSRGLDISFNGRLGGDSVDVTMVEERDSDSSSMRSNNMIASQQVYIFDRLKSDERPRV